MEYSLCLNAPKRLPWMAKQHGISPEVAAALWPQAINSATQELDIVGDSIWHQTCMYHLDRLMAEESIRMTCIPGRIIAAITKRVPRRIGVRLAVWGFTRGWLSFAQAEVLFCRL